MKEKKFFDKRIYFEALRQLKTIGVVYFVLLMLQAILLPLYAYIIAQGKDIDAALTYIDFYTTIMLQYFIAILLPIAAAQLFSFVDSRKASDFYHSLPVRRETMYISFICALISLGVFLYAVPTLVQYILLSGIPKSELVMDNFWIASADILVIGLLLSSVVILSKNIAGNRFGQIALMGMILYLPRIFILIISVLIRYIAPIIVLGKNKSLLWDESWNLMFFTGMTQWRSVVYTFILAVLYFILAGIVFVRRKSEKAESVAISPKAQLILRMIPALTFSFLPMFGIISLIHEDEGLSGDVIVILFIAYVITIVIYFLYELLTTRKLKSVISAAPGLVVLLALHLLILAGIELYSNTELHRCPEASEIKNVRIIDSSDTYDRYLSYSGYDSFFEGSFGFLRNSVKDCSFTSDSIKELIADSLKESIENCEDDVEYSSKLTVIIDTGRDTLCRKLFLNNQKKDTIRRAILTSEEYGSIDKHLPNLDDINIILQDFSIEANNRSISSFTDTERSLFTETIYEEFSKLDKDIQYDVLSRTMVDCFFVNISYSEIIRNKKGDIDHYGRYYTVQFAVSKELMPESFNIISKAFTKAYLEDELD